MDHFVLSNYIAECVQIDTIDLIQKNTDMGSILFGQFQIKFINSKYSAGVIGDNPTT